MLKFRPIHLTKNNKTFKDMQSVLSYIERTGAAPEYRMDISVILSSISKIWGKKLTGPSYFCIFLTKDCADAVVAGHM